MYAVPPGARFVYEFQLDNRAGTYWFHPHPHGGTGEQVYRGLAGALIVSDEEEQAVGSPADELDLTWVLQDLTLDPQQPARLRAGHDGADDGLSWRARPGQRPA